MKKLLTKDNLEALLALILIITVCLLAPDFIEMAVKAGVYIGDKL